MKMFSILFTKSAFFYNSTVFPIKKPQTNFAPQP